MTVGEEVTLIVDHVDDVGVSWRQQSEDNARGFFVVDGDERDEFIGGEPDTRIQQAVFRAELAGKVTITAEEVMMGPAICFPPYPELSTVACAITIIEQ